MCESCTSYLAAMPSDEGSVAYLRWLNRGWPVCLDDYEASAKETTPLGPAILEGEAAERAAEILVRRGTARTNPYEEP